MIYKYLIYIWIYMENSNVWLIIYIPDIYYDVLKYVFTVR